MSQDELHYWEEEYEEITCFSKKLQCERVGFPLDAVMTMDEDSNFERSLLGLEVPPLGFSGRIGQFSIICPIL